MFDAKKEPTYWFVLLEKAIANNNFQAAAEAKRQLLQLGIAVKYLRRHTQETAHA